MDLTVDTGIAHFGGTEVVGVSTIGGMVAISV